MKSKALILVLCILYLSCSKHSPAPQTPAQKATALLTASAWTMQSLTIDGASDDTFFKGLAITFTGSDFSAQNGEPVWPASGTWDFTDTNATSIKRDDGIVVSIDNLSKTDMQLSLEWTQTTTGGRVGSIAGKHVFV